MNKLIAILAILGFLLPVPVRAQISTDFDPVEKKLRSPSSFEELITDDARKAGEQPKPGTKSAQGKSNWWKWALGAVLIAGVAAAAGGGGGGGDTPPAPTTGTVSGSW